MLSNVEWPKSATFELTKARPVSVATVLTGAAEEALASSIFTGPLICAYACPRNDDRETKCAE